MQLGSGLDPPIADFDILSEADIASDEVREHSPTAVLRAFHTSDSEEKIDVEQIIALNIRSAVTDLHTFSRTRWSTYRHPAVERQFLRFVAPHRWSTSVGALTFAAILVFYLVLLLQRDSAQLSIVAVLTAVVSSFCCLILSIATNLCVRWSRLTHARFAEISLWAMTLELSIVAIVEAYPGILACARSDKWNDCGSGIKPNYICVPILSVGLVNIRLPLCLPLIWVSPLVFVGRFVAPDPGEVLTGKILVNFVMCVLATILVLARDSENRKRFEVWISMQRRQVEVKRRQQETAATLNLIIGDSTVQDLLSQGIAIRDSSQCCTVVVCTIHDFHSWMMAFTSTSAAEVCDVFHATADKWRLKFGMQLISGVGDQYVAALGLRSTQDRKPEDTHCDRHDATPALQFAMEMLHVARAVRSSANSTTGIRQEESNLHLRIGIATGPCEGALLGAKSLYYNAAGPAFQGAKLIADITEIDHTFVDARTVDLSDHRVKVKVKNSPTVDGNPIFALKAVREVSNANRYLRIDVDPVAVPTLQTSDASLSRSFNAQDDFFKSPDVNVLRTPSASDVARQNAFLQRYGLRRAMREDDNDGITAEMVQEAFRRLSGHSEPSAGNYSSPLDTRYWDEMSNRVRRKAAYIFIQASCGALVLLSLISLQSGYEPSNTVLCLCAVFLPVTSLSIKKRVPNKVIGNFVFATVCLQCVLMMFAWWATSPTVALVRAHNVYLVIFCAFFLMEAAVAVPWKLGAISVFAAVLLLVALEATDRIRAGGLTATVAAPFIFSAVIHVREVSSRQMFLYKIASKFYLQQSIRELELQESVLERLLPRYVVPTVTARHSGEGNSCVTDHLHDVAIAAVRFESCSESSPNRIYDLDLHIGKALEECTAIALVTCLGDVFTIGGPLQKPSIDFKSAIRSVGGARNTARSNILLAFEEEAADAAAEVVKLISDLLQMENERQFSAIVDRGDALAMVLGRQQPRFQLFGYTARKVETLLTQAPAGYKACSEEFYKALAETTKDRQLAFNAAGLSVDEVPYKWRTKVCGYNYVHTLGKL